MKDGLNTFCIKCHKADNLARKKEYRADPVFHEKELTYKKRYREKTVEQRKRYMDKWHKENDAKYREANKEKIRESYKRHVNTVEGKAKLAARCRARQIRKILAMPKWAEVDKIITVYKKAKLYGFTVDHIVPLKSSVVCGLHTWANLQLLDNTYNIQKSNRVWPDMPE